MTNSESPGIIEGPREPKPQIYIMPQIMLTASKTPQWVGCNNFRVPLPNEKLKKILSFTSAVVEPQEKPIL